MTFMEKDQLAGECGTVLPEGNIVLDKIAEYNPKLITQHICEILKENTKK